jgi:hypothetical protein
MWIKIFMHDKVMNMFIGDEPCVLANIAEGVEMGYFEGWEYLSR